HRRRCRTLTTPAPRLEAPMSENTYRCPVCSAAYTIGDAIAPGQSTRCGKCRAVFTVRPDVPAGPRRPPPPIKAAAEKAKRPPADEKEDSREKSQGPSRGGANVALILAGVALATVLLCGAP